MTKTIYVLNGPNMNLLGKRQPELYGSKTLSDVEKSCSVIAHEKAFKIDLRQSNNEADLIDWIHEARKDGAGIIINPAAYSHTSIAIMDALMTFEGPVIEVHVSNIHKREKFRHQSYVSLRADGVIAGLGVRGYEFAVIKILEMLEK
ncbi:MAG: type II 3-dehydroquinate dehydratase [Paracoccaceae bacterium]|jgi:3-dehydroquinate dehydratase-2|nr:type II 3-dehydroquinate dehydratase [Paracoccaceae bacterium]|tara:strand:+ start:1047 stop:1487 length:441 start_codon:yes stop_codon:yes gene_type:complete